MPKTVEDVPYLDYLDKEMSIMGILSTFCVLVVGGAIGGFAAAKEGEVARELWLKSWDYIITGSGLILLAALFFYGQRSHLAWYYGQICLSIESPDLSAHDRSIHDWLQRADSYSAWISYPIALGLLLSGFAEYFLALVNAKHTIPWATVVAWPPALMIIILLPKLLIQWKYDLQDDIWKKSYADFISTCARPFSRGRNQ
jgi:hypothetical protein